MAFRRAGEVGLPRAGPGLWSGDGRCEIKSRGSHQATAHRQASAEGPDYRRQWRNGSEGPDVPAV